MEYPKMLIDVLLNAKKVAVLTGALAQLGERLPCTQEVIGSTPIFSTFSLQKALLFEVLFYCSFNLQKIA